MELHIPERCMDCYNLYTYGEMTVCRSLHFSSELKAQDITAFRVNPSERPEWCPNVKIKKYFDALPQDKQEAMEDITRGLSKLFSVLGGE